MIVHASTREQCQRKFNAAIQLLHSARQRGAHVTEARVLESHEYDSALSYLKQEYTDKYMSWPGLAEAWDDWTEGHSFDRAAKDQMRGDFRKGFLQQLGGSASLAYAILRHGFSTRDAIFGVVREIFSANQKRAAEMQNNPTPTTRTHPHLYAAAQAARQRWRQGRRLDQRRATARFNFGRLHKSDQQILMDFDSGKCFRDMVSANKAYGHGIGAPEQGLSIEKIAVLEYQLRDTTDLLEAYFNRT